MRRLTRAEAAGIAAFYAAFFGIIYGLAVLLA